MTHETDDALWQRLSKALFGVRKTSDGRVFTAGVMAEIRKLQPADSSWRLFARWALPTLALSMSSFTIALVYSLKPDPVSAETLLLEDQEPAVSEEWLASPPETDALFEKAVNP